MSGTRSKRHRRSFPGLHLDERARGEVGDPEDLTVGLPFHLRVLGAVLRVHPGRGAFEHITVARAGRGLTEVFAKKIGQGAVGDGTICLRRTILIRHLLVAASGDEHVLVGERHPPARTCRRGWLAQAARNRRRRQSRNRPPIGDDATGLSSEQVTRDGAGVAGVDNQGRIGCPGAQRLEFQLNFVVRDVPVLVRGAPAVKRHDCAVEAARLVALAIGHPRPMSRVVDHHDVVRAGGGDENVEGGKDGVPGRLVVRQQVDVVGSEAEIRDEHVPHQLDIVDATVKLRHVRVGIDADEDRASVADVRYAAHGTVYRMLQRSAV